MMLALRKVRAIVVADGMSGNSDAMTRDVPISAHRRPQHARSMPHYRRCWVPGGTYFFTVNLLERRRRLLVEHIDDLRDAFRQAQAQRPFGLPAWVILPDHLHCVWVLPDGDADIATRWRHIKTRFARAQPAGEWRSCRRIVKGERGIWQRRYWEHVVRDERNLRRCIDYIHFNPVKHGLAARVANWPHSSFHRFVRDGRLPADWAG